jgi:hypothetical protein
VLALWCEEASGVMCSTEPKHIDVAYGEEPTRGAPMHVGVHVGAPEHCRAVAPCMTSTSDFNGVEAKGGTYAKEEAWVPLATTWGAAPTGAAVPEVPIRGLEPIGSGVQSSFDR